MKVVGIVGHSSFCLGTQFSHLLPPLCLRVSTAPIVLPIMLHLVRQCNNVVPNLVHTQFGQARNIPRNHGKSVEFRRFGAMSAVTTAMTDGTVPAVTAIPTIATVTASIAFYGAYVQGTDQVEALAIDPVLSEMSEVLGEQAGDSIDQIVRDVLVAGATVRYSGGATSRGGVGSGTGYNMTATVFRQAVRTLKRNNARPVRGNKYAVIFHPDTEYDLFGDSTVQNTFLYAAPRDRENEMFTGELGEWMGCVFVESSNAKKYASASNNPTGLDVYATLFIGANAYGVTEIDGENLQSYYKPKGSGGSTGDPLDQVWSMGWKVALAAAVLNSNFIVSVEHMTSTSFGG